MKYSRKSRKERESGGEDTDIIYWLIQILGASILGTRPRQKERKSNRQTETPKWDSHSKGEVGREGRDHISWRYKHVLNLLSSGWLQLSPETLILLKNK